jgi:hypothetical protein
MEMVGLYWILAVVVGAGWLALLVAGVACLLRRGRRDRRMHVLLSAAIVWLVALFAIDALYAASYRRVVANFASVEEGMSKDEVEHLLGNPCHAWLTAWDKTMGPYEHWSYHRAHFIAYLKGRFPFIGVQSPFDRSPFGRRSDDYVVRFDGKKRVRQTRVPCGKWLPVIEE